MHQSGHRGGRPGGNQAQTASTEPTAADPGPVGMLLVCGRAIAARHNNMLGKCVLHDMIGHSLSRRHFPTMCIRCSIAGSICFFLQNGVLLHSDPVVFYDRHFFGIQGALGKMLELISCWILIILCRQGCLWGRRTSWS